MVHNDLFRRVTLVHCQLALVQEAVYLAVFLVREIAGPPDKVASAHEGLLSW